MEVELRELLCFRARPMRQERRKQRLSLDSALTALECLLFLNEIRRLFEPSVEDGRHFLRMLMTFFKNLVASFRLDVRVILNWLGYTEL